MTVGNSDTVAERPYNMAKRQKASHEKSPELATSNSSEPSSYPMEDEDFEQAIDRRSDIEQALMYAAGSNMPDLNIVEFRRTESDDEPIEPEPVPLSDSELPPRPKLYKKKKSKKSSKSKDAQPKDNTCTNKETETTSGKAS